MASEDDKDQGSGPDKSPGRKIDRRDVLLGLSTGVYCLGWDLNIQLRFGKLNPPLPRTEELNPLVNCYRAGDGRWFWLLGVESQRHWPNLCRSIGRDDLIDDDRFADGRGRRHRASELVALLDATFAERTRAEWIDAFDAHGVSVRWP